METEHEQATRLFYDLVWPLRAEVVRVARLLLRDASEADDLAQEALMRAFAGIRSFRPGTDARAWLLTILRNARVDRLRSRQAHEAERTLSLDALEHEPAGIGTDDASPEWRDDPERVLDAFSDQQVIDALAELPEEIRWTLLLADVQQMEQRDVAEVLGVPVGTIKSRVHRGRAMLRTALLPVARQMRLVQ